MRRKAEKFCLDSRKKYAAQYNLRRRDINFKIGSLVQRKNNVLSDASKHFTAGLAPSFKGPFEIAKVLDNNQYELKTLSGERTGIFAGDQLKVCFI